MTQPLQEKILNVLMLITGTILIIMVIWYIFGNSPTIDQFIVGFGVLFLENLFSINSRLGSIESTLKHHTHEISSIKSDVEFLKKDMFIVKQDISMLKQDNIIIKHKLKL